MQDVLILNERRQVMDFEVMKKKLDAYRKPKGQFRDVKGELQIELLRMWESHAGASANLPQKRAVLWNSSQLILSECGFGAC